MHTVVSSSHFYNDFWILRIFFFFSEDGPCVRFLLLFLFSKCFASGKRTRCSYITDLTTVGELKKYASFFRGYLPVAANETRLCVKQSQRAGSCSSSGTTPCCGVTRIPEFREG